MFSGAQISLYTMSDGFVGIILGALHALDPYRSDRDSGSLSPGC